VKKEARALYFKVHEYEVYIQEVCLRYVSIVFMYNNRKYIVLASVMNG
jgi:hypothetical protein